MNRLFIGVRIKVRVRVRVQVQVGIGVRVLIYASFVRKEGKLRLKDCDFVLSQLDFCD